VAIEILHDYTPSEAEEFRMATEGRRIGRRSGKRAAPSYLNYLFPAGRDKEMGRRVKTRLQTT
jgi:hypothetical protein